MESAKNTARLVMTDDSCGDADTGGGQGSEPRHANTQIAVLLRLGLGGRGRGRQIGRRGESLCQGPPTDLQFGDPGGGGTGKWGNSLVASVSPSSVLMARSGEDQAHLDGEGGAADRSVKHQRTSIGVGKCLRHGESSEWQFPLP